MSDSKVNTLLVPLDGLDGLSDLVESALGDSTGAAAGSFGSQAKDRFLSGGAAHASGTTWVAYASHVMVERGVLIDGRAKADENRPANAITRTVYAQQLGVSGGRVSQLANLGYLGIVGGIDPQSGEWRALCNGAGWAKQVTPLVDALRKAPKRTVAQRKAAQAALRKALPTALVEAGFDRETGVKIPRTRNATPGAGSKRKAKRDALDVAALVAALDRIGTNPGGLSVEDLAKVCGHARTMLDNVTAWRDSQSKDAAPTPPVVGRRTRKAVQRAHGKPADIPAAS